MCTSRSNCRTYSCRDPETGGVSHDPELYAETVRLIREADEDIVINVTSGGGGDFIPSLEHPETGGELGFKHQKNVLNLLVTYYHVY